MIALLLTLALAQEPPADAPAESAPVEAVRQAPATAVSTSLVVKVGQPDEATDALVKAADELGGWFQARTRDQVSLRVPTDQIDALIAKAESLGKVTDRSAERVDLTHQLVEARGRLKAREEVLERYYEVLESADPASIVGVESQIVAAIEVIEQLKGRIRVLEDRATNARVDVAFRFRDRQAPKRDGSSSFPWLNTLNVTDVLGGLQTTRPHWTSRGSAPQAPTGFSAWRKQGRFRAASPDGVLYRVRTVRHKPQADPAFWREAVTERMKAAGYTVVTLEEQAQGGFIELVSPLGQEDWTYAIQFAVSGNRLVIAEAAGEVSRFEARRTAIRDALAASAP